MGLPKPKINYPAWWAHLIKMTGSTLKNEGPAKVLKRVGRVFNPTEPKHA